MAEDRDHDQAEEGAIKAEKRQLKIWLILRKGRNGNQVSDQGTKTAIGKYATINGNKKAVEKFVVSVSQKLL